MSLAISTCLPFGLRSLPSHRQMLFRSSVSKQSNIGSIHRSKKVACVSEEYEGPNMQPLDLSSTGGLGGTSDGVFGPLAVLLVGFTRSEVFQFEKMLQEIDADMVKLISCPSNAMTKTLEEAISMQSNEGETNPMGSRRIVFLSGMVGSEVQEVICAYRDNRLPETVFAAYVPKNKDKRICDLIDEVYEDHEYMMRKKNQERSPDM